MEYLTMTGQSPIFYAKIVVCSRRCLIVPLKIHNVICRSQFTMAGAVANKLDCFHNITDHNLKIQF